DRTIEFQTGSLPREDFVRPKFAKVSVSESVEIDALLATAKAVTKPGGLVVRGVPPSVAQVGPMELGDLHLGTATK
ncbi:MAG: hypothetical protein ACREIA_19465, partial [Opitutaceae bacterium]